MHCTNYGVDGSIGLADNNLVLPPGAAYTAEWILVPVEATDYYSFINTARRFMGANFLIDGGFAFLRAGQLTEAWSDDQVQKFLKYKNPKYDCATIDSDYKGRYSHGTAFQQVDHERFPRAFERWRRLYPDVSCLVYWDEHQYSNEQYHYGEPWDHFTGDLDPQSLQIRGLKSSVTLLTEDWRVNLAKSIQFRGSLIGNGAPCTRAMAVLDFPCFVETVTPTHKTITSQMFPITPLEIHAGYVIGEERIVTRLSGTYGWGDDSPHEVHVYNAEGEEVTDFDAPFTEKDGVTWTELRLAEDWSAVIVHRSVDSLASCSYLPGCSKHQNPRH